MRGSIFISVLLVSGMVIISCTSKMGVQTSGEIKSNEVWEEGLSIVTGTISVIEQNKDGQNLILYNNKGIKYTAIVNPTNLGNNAFQYRSFKVGESVGFKGNLLENQQLIVREILAMD